jgi:hypothetical protein
MNIKRGQAPPTGVWVCERTEEGDRRIGRSELGDRESLGEGGDFAPLAEHPVRAMRPPRGSS